MNMRQTISVIKNIKNRGLREHDFQKSKGQSGEGKPLFRSLVCKQQAKEKAFNTYG